jgi:hypothetical protein
MTVGYRCLSCGETWQVQHLKHGGTSRMVPFHGMNLRLDQCTECKGAGVRQPGPEVKVEISPERRLALLAAGRREPYDVSVTDYDFVGMPPLTWGELRKLLGEQADPKEPV